MEKIKFTGIVCRAAKRMSVFFAAVSMILLMGLRSPSFAAEKPTKFQELLAPRTVYCWIEGSALDEIVLNARAKLSFVYVDRKLGDAMYARRKGSDARHSDERDSVPEWLFDNGWDYRKKKDTALFVLHVEAMKPWTFDTSQVFIGGYRLNDADIVKQGKSIASFVVEGGAMELPGDFSTQLSFFVPAKDLKPGETIALGYGDYRVEWKVPAKNE